MTRAWMGVLAIAACLGGAGCSKKLDCGPAGYSNSDPPFCFAMPAGYEAGKPQGKAPMSMSVHPKESILGFTVYWNEEGTLDDRAKRVAGMASDSLKLDGSGDIDGGKWWKFRDVKFNSTFAVVLVKGEKGVIRCELQNRPDADAPKELEACKSLRGG